MRKYLYFLLSLALLTACKEKTGVEMDPDLYDISQVALKVKGSRVFTYTEGATQLGFNRSRKEFRAGNDDMTSYFIVTCSDLPVREGQEIKADLKWTSGNSSKSTSGVMFQVVKIEDTGLVWLWNAADKTGAVVKVLN